MSTVEMTVNGKQVSADVEDRTLLSAFLRENLNLTGTPIGCDTSQCGTCVVHVDGKVNVPHDTQIIEISKFGKFNFHNSVIQIKCIVN